MRFAICNELFEGWDFRRVVEFVAETGYEGLEIAPFTLGETVEEISADRRQEVRKIAEDRGIVLAGLHWLLVKPAGLHLLSPEENVRRRTVDYLRRLIDFCADIGGKVMVFGSPNQRSVPAGMERARAWELARESFAACGATAASRGVTLCLEALPADLTNFLNTNAGIIEMVRAIDHPSIRMMLDVKSMCAESIGIPENIRACEGWFRHVHANDANLQGPGFGAVDFRPILQTLRELKYRGFVSVEVFDFTPGPEVTARESLRYMRNCLEPSNPLTRS
ncbi:MAG: sugar phosphate isomerase/epimerase family protein [Opitutaceae bacterium]